MSKKLETKSDGVKGLSFHRTKAWILASLESGVIQLWDYTRATLIDQFHHHRGRPVRGVHFHDFEPLFVSGGDDHKIKVWNHTLRRCMFSLEGHLDVIRTVQFHHICPVIVSASDDRTIRIWNWESRTCCCVLTGHTGSVMSASFHRDEGLVLSASLDKTLRVWDVVGLLIKADAGQHRWGSNAERAKSESYPDAYLKFVLRGHDRGVNWAAFHPCVPHKSIVSGADDHQVKTWYMHDSCTGAWEEETLSGHMSNVSCVLFHKISASSIVSSSEDGSILVWDARTRTHLQMFRREHDRFSILASHPLKMNIFAAGHDSGMFVFKLERDRPNFAVSGDSMFHLANFFGWTLRFYNYAVNKKSQFISSIPILRPHCPYLNQGAKMLSYSSTENVVLISSDTDGGSYELYIIPEDRCHNNKNYRPIREAGKGSGGWAVFVARNRFAVLDNRTNQILVKNLKNEIIEKIVIPIATDAIFYAGTEKLLCRAEDRVLMFDLQQRIILGELQTCLVKHVFWSNDMESVALLSKHSIVVASKNLVHQCSLHEEMRIKSGAWDDNGVFIYSTLNHIKYCLPNGDSGIIRSVYFPLFITKVSGSFVHGLDAEGRDYDIKVDATEYLIKIHLLKKRYGEVMSMLRSSEIYRHTVVAYLQQKGLPEVALRFAKDEKTRFNLALETGDIQTAFSSAKLMDDKNHWYRLGKEALRQGDVGMAKYAYKMTNTYRGLSFLYLITGNLDKLSKMQNIAEVENDVIGKFNNALFAGDIRERVNILENAGNLYLACATAAVHGLHETADRLAVALRDKFLCLPSAKSHSLLVPPRPVIRGAKWPLLRVTRGSVPANVGWNTEEFEAANTTHGEGFSVIADEEHLQDGVLRERVNTNKFGGWNTEELI